MALAGKVGAFYAQDKTVVFPATPMVAVAGSKRMFRVNNELYRHFDDSVPVVVLVAGVKPVINYVVQHARGYVVFDADVVGAITVAGNYWTLKQVGGCSNWEASLDGETADCTTFESAGWREFQYTLKGWTASADKFWTLEDLVTDDGGKTYRANWFDKSVLCVLYMDVANQVSLEGYGLCSSQTISSPVDGLIEAPLEIQGSGGIYLRVDKVEIEPVDETKKEQGDCGKELIEADQAENREDAARLESDPATCGQA